MQSPIQRKSNVGWLNLQSISKLYDAKKAREMEINNKNRCKTSFSSEWQTKRVHAAASSIFLRSSIDEIGEEIFNSLVSIRKCWKYRRSAAAALFSTLINLNCQFVCGFFSLLPSRNDVFLRSQNIQMCVYISTQSKIEIAEC